ncbi:MMPL family transporter [Dactylosporangium sp. CS-033363]|uniref:MMPL family transporter n=1 Tax=Dactylosporangium sp. CS-033363 TaxID=3239935 RepID=UPI003D9440C8
MAKLLARLGRFSFRRRLPVLLVWLLVLAGAIVAGLTAPAAPDDDFSMPGTESQRTFELMRQRFPGLAADAGGATIVFVAPKGASVEDERYRTAITTAVEKLGGGEQVAMVGDPFEGGGVSDDKSAAYASVMYKVPASKVTVASRDQISAAAESARAAGLTVDAGGDALEAPGPGGIAELVAISLAAVILLVALGSLVAAGLPLLTALLGVGVTMLSLLALGKTFGLSQTTTTLALMLGLAVGIDYALFVLARYREERSAGRTAIEAVEVATGTAGSAVAFAGLTVVIALAGLTVVGMPMLTKMGLAAVAAVVIAVLIALTLVPAVIGFVPDRVLPRRAPADRTPPNRTPPDRTLADQTLADQTPNQPLADQTLPDRTPPNRTLADQTLADQTLADQTPNQPLADQTLPDRTPPNRTLADQTLADQTPNQPLADQTLPDRTSPNLTSPNLTSPNRTLARRALERLRRIGDATDGSCAAAHERQRPVRKSIAILGFLVLAALAVPALDLRLGMPGDEARPATTTQRRAYDALAKAFGPGFNGPLMIVVDAKGATDPQSAVSAIADKVGKVRGMASVSPPQFNEAGDTALFEAVPTTAPTDAATQTLVRDLRAARPGMVAGTGATFHVTGTTAINIDLSAKIQQALMLYLATVVGLAVLLLLVVFRSILVPLKAALGFLLSVLAALGAVVLVFQRGVAAGLFGVEQTGPIQSAVPIFTIGVVFGLAMDYEVFLVSRMREAYINGLDPRAAVETGLRRSSRVVIAAALIMMAVFAGFVTEQDPFIKMLGFSLAAAVCFDAFVVRLAIVPAVMALLGRRAWWLPRGLDRIVPRVDVEGTKIQRKPPESAMLAAARGERAATRGEPQQTQATPGERAAAHGEWAGHTRSGDE